MSAAGVGGHTDRGADESAKRPSGERERKRDRDRDPDGFGRIFLPISGARLAVAESRLSIFNAIMSRRV